MANLNIALFDANSYFASCHQAVEPELRGKPVLVGGDPNNRTGIVVTSSYEARFRGVKTGMLISEALRRCPDAIVKAHDFPLYLELSEKMWSIVGRYTDAEHIEVVSVDECFADFSGSQLLFGNTANIAKRIQKQIWEELHLGVSVGISYCKTFAKLGSELVRDPLTGIKKPRSFAKISPEDLETVVWSFQVDALSGVGRTTKAKLHQLNIRTIGDLAGYPSHLLKSSLGEQGLLLQNLALGLDNQVVSPHNTAANPSISRSITLPYNLIDPEDVAQALLSLSDHVGTKIRKEQAKARTLTLTIRTPEFKTVSFSKTLSQPTALTQEIYTVCYDLYQEKWPRTIPIRLVGIGASNLIFGNEQLVLFNETKQAKEDLDRTVDRLRDKFGLNSIIRGSEMMPVGNNVFLRKDR